MITLTLDWREALWYFSGGMSGSHIRWSVYEDMVNRVWPQCDEQTRRNMHYVMRRDLGCYWRPAGFNGYDRSLKGEGPWKADDDGYAIDPDNPDGERVRAIYDITPWMYFRQVLARFDPDNQWAVTIAVHNQEELDSNLRFLSQASIISRPTNIPKGKHWQSDTATLTVRAYRWQDDYRIDWDRRVAPDAIVKAEQLEIPDTGEM